ncbi:hypothetical protein C8R44DRAFT_395733 [Mycena epipterygia]|nr:hypothetical protein C8R44DRAFT_395733 [Mycena epipterygia]
MCAPAPARVPRRSLRAPPAPHEFHQHPHYAPPQHSGLRSYPILDTILSASMAPPIQKNGGGSSRSCTPMMRLEFVPGKLCDRAQARPLALAPRTTSTVILRLPAPALPARSPARRRRRLSSFSHLPSRSHPQFSQSKQAARQSSHIAPPGATTLSTAKISTPMGCKSHRSKWEGFPPRHAPLLSNTTSTAHAHPNENGNRTPWLPGVDHSPRAAFTLFVFSASTCGAPPSRASCRARLRLPERRGEQPASGGALGHEARFPAA